VPLCRICTARLRPQTLAATLQEAAPTRPPCTAPPLGDFPPKSIRHCTKNQRGRSGRRRRKWGRPGPPPRCRALGSRRGEAHPAGVPIGTPPRIRSRAHRGLQFRPQLLCFLVDVRPRECRRRRNAKEPGLLHKEDFAAEAMDRAALLPLLQAIPRCSSPPPRRRVQESKVSLTPSPCCGPGLRAEAGPSLVSSLFECCPLSRIAPPRRPTVA
jgi:hypothetical protein